MKSNAPVEIDGQIFSVYGIKGFVLDDSWFLCIDQDTFRQSKPDPISPKIEEIITQQPQGVDCILVNPEHALKLCLEEKVSKQDLIDAEASDKSIIFNKVEFSINKETHTFKVVILPKSEYKIATLDKDGIIITTSK
jgi:hypothetical protein